MHSATANSRRVRLILLSASLVTGFAIAAVLGWGQLSSPDAPSPGGALGPLAEPSDGPFFKGESVTLSEAEERVSFSILRPDDAMASDESLDEVWVEVVPLPGEEVAVSEQVALDYSSGIRVYLEPGNRTEADMLALYTKIVADEGGDWAIGEVQGQPALMIPPDSPPDIDLDNPGSVAFVLKGVQVTVLGDYPLDDILRVANSVREV